MSTIAHISLFSKAELKEFRRQNRIVYVCEHCGLKSVTKIPPTDENGFRHKVGRYVIVEVHPWDTVNIARQQLPKEAKE